jgi:hypothetical protein
MSRMNEHNFMCARVVRALNMFLIINVSPNLQQCNIRTRGLHAVHFDWSLHVQSEHDIYKSITEAASIAGTRHRIE